LAGLARDWRGIGRDWRGMAPIPHQSRPIPSQSRAIPLLSRPILQQSRPIPRKCRPIPRASARCSACGQHLPPQQSRARRVPMQARARHTPHLVSKIDKRLASHLSIVTYAGCGVCGREGHRKRSATHDDVCVAPARACTHVALRPPSCEQAFGGEGAAATGSEKLSAPPPPYNTKYKRRGRRAGALQRQR